jgi:folate-binding protein YgfZ
VFREDVRILDLGVAIRVTPGPAVRAPVHPALTERDGRPERISIPGAPEYTLSPALARGGPPASGAADWDRDRIVMGWAGQGGEIGADFNPFEINLGHAVHLDKGCFTGHESLMRLVTYRGVRRRLVRLAGDGAPAAPCAVTRPDGTAAGVLTSVWSADGAWTGLGVLSAQAGEPGTSLAVAGTSAARVAEVFEVRPPLGRPLRL